MVNRVTLTAAKDPFHTAARFGDQPAIPTVTNREKDTIARFSAIESLRRTKENHSAETISGSNDTIARFSAIEPRKSDEVKRGSSYCSAAKQIFRRLKRCPACSFIDYWPVRSVSAEKLQIRR